MMVTLTALNGRLPSSLLTLIERGQSLRTDAAASWHRMEAAGMPKGCLRSGYRDLDAQRVEIARAKAGLTPSAAPAGESFHGEGTAADVDEPARAWITAHGAPHGYISGRVPREPWHKEFEPARDTAPKPAPVTVKPTPAKPAPPTPPVQEDDMAMFQLYFRNSDGAVILAAPGHVTVLDAGQYQTWQNLGYHAIGMDDWPLEVILKSLRPTAPQV